MNTQCHTAFNVTRGGNCDAPTQTKPAESEKPATGNEITYTVKAGDILFNIAKKYGVDFKKLAADNGLSNPNLIYPGQILIIKDAKANEPVEYTVKAGDTLSGIAAKYGVDYKQIAADNGISNPALIYPGQKLTIKR